MPLKVRLIALFVEETLSRQPFHDSSSGSSQTQMATLQAEIFPLEQPKDTNSVLTHLQLPLPDAQETPGSMGGSGLGNHTALSEECIYFTKNNFLFLQITFLTLKVEILIYGPDPYGNPNKPQRLPIS